MFTEKEVGALLKYPGILDKIAELKQQFVDEEAEYLEIEDHDFLSLILMTPSVGIALSNGSVSLFEEMALNKKARKLSKGGYFLKKDPVVFAMEHLIKGYDKWSPIFYEHIKKLMYKTVDVNAIIDKNFKVTESNELEQFVHVLKSPFVVVRFLTSFFMNDEEEDIFSERKISQVEYDRVNKIADQLGFTEFPIYQIYHSNLVVK